MHRADDREIIDVSERIRSRPRPVRRALSRVALALAVVVVCSAAWVVGDSLRRWVWDQTVGIRFLADVNNGFRWGSVAVDGGLLNVYRDLTQAFQGDPSPDYRLDYPPLRLAMMSLWVRWNRAHLETGGLRWQPDYTFHRPILLLNMACEALAALGVYLVIREALLRRRLAGGATPAALSLSWSEHLAAMAGALLVWFSPAVVFNDSWPQWDAWILPPFISAVWLAMRERWLAAGVLLAVGAMLKGQLLMVAPVFVLWPLFGLRLGAAARFIAGFAFGFTVSAAAWTITTPKDIVIVAAGSIVAIALLFCWPRKWKVAWRWRWAMAAVVCSFSIWATTRWSSGDLSWFDVGFGYGSRKFMHMGERGTSNLAMLLQESWGWDIVGPSGTLTLPLSAVGLTDRDLTMRAFLTALYGVTLVLCGAAAAWHWRRRSPRLLVALYAPWVLSFALLPQMNNRYLYWGGALFGMIAASGVGGLLLGLFMSLACCAMMLEVMCRFSPGYFPIVESVVSRMYPGLAYAVLLGAAVMLYMALVPTDRGGQADGRDRGD